jgi:acetyl esterase/lipase
MKKITSLLFMMFFVAINAQIRIELPYTETGLEIYPEKTFDSFFGEGVFIDNVTKPEMHFYEAKGENITDKVMIICPGGGLFFSAYEKEGTLLAEKLSNNGINAIVLKYTLYPIDGNAQKWLNENWGSQDDIIKKAKKTLPFSVNDALNAIENIRNNSKKYKVDPNKIGLMGFSAGGAVTMEASYKATEKNQPNFIAPIYPWMLIVEDQKVPDNKPPAFISCANNDILELAPLSVKIYQDWILADAKAELHMYDMGGHGFGMTMQNSPVDNWSNLLVDWILSL